MQGEIKVGDLVRVVEPQVLAARKRDGVPSVGVAVRVEPIFAGSTTLYVEFRACGRNYGCAASAMEVCNATEKRWRRSDQGAGK